MQDKNTPLIRDIPHIKKNLENVRNMRAFKNAMPFLGPVLKLFGADVTGINEAMSGIEELERIGEELASIPDRFNDLFAARGWIIYDLMNVDVAKAAIAKAEAGDPDEAEGILVDYYSPETVEWKLHTMYGVKAFRLRIPLAEKALADYREERYHACVPVVLALLDGMVNDLHEKRRGFFAEEVDLQAWDSVAAHSTGLNALALILQKGRYKTTTEQITIPYRNGILHGMDVGYDNRIVAAKSWAALFAARDWAVRAEQGQLTEPPAEPQTPWRELFAKIRQNSEDKARLEAWQPRLASPGSDVPTTGEPDVFGNGTPEQKLAEFLSYWKRNNYGYMAQCIASLAKGPANKAVVSVRQVHGAKKLKAFKFLAINNHAPAITIIKTKLSYEESGSMVESEIDFRLLFEDSKGGVAIPGKPDCKWSVVNWGF